jgi:hypothetical protein
LFSKVSQLADQVKADTKNIGDEQMMKLELSQEEISQLDKAKASKKKQILQQRQLKERIKKIQEKRDYCNYLEYLDRLFGTNVIATTISKCNNNIFASIQESAQYL